MKLFQQYVSHTVSLSVCLCAKLLQAFLTLWDTMDYSPPGSLFMGFSRQEHCSGLPCPPPADLLKPGIEPASFFFLIVRQFINQFNQTEIEKSRYARMFLEWEPEIWFESQILHCYSKCKKSDKMSFLSRGRQYF